MAAPGWKGVGVTVAFGSGVTSCHVLTTGTVPELVLAILMAAFMVYTHRANIARLRAGTENRVKRLWLLRPRDAGR